MEFLISPIISGNLLIECQTSAFVCFYLYSAQWSVISIIMTLLAPQTGINIYFQLSNPIAEPSNLMEQEEANLHFMNPWHVLMNLVDLAEEEDGNEDFVESVMKKVKATDSAAPVGQNLLVPTNSRVFGFAPKRKFFW